VVYTLAQPPAHGALQVGGATIGAQGSFTQADIDAGRVSYTHDGSETQSDALGISVADGASAPLTGLSFAIGVRPVNDPPVAGDDVASTQTGQPLRIAVLANDSDAEGDALRLSGVSAAIQGTVTIDAGAIVYTPGGGFVGVDSFTYTVSDVAGAVGQGQVTVYVRESGPAPGARLYLPLLAR
jgi:hypothetical protein